MNLIGFLNKHKNIIFNTAIILVAAFIGLKIYGVMEKKRLKLEETKVVEQKKNGVLGDISGMETRLTMYKNFLNNKDVSTLINTVGTMARESSVNIVSVRPSPEEAYTAYIRKYPIDLIIETDSYHALGKFVSLLENHPDVYTVEIITIAPSGSMQEKAGFKLTVNLRISTFLFKG